MPKDGQTSKPSAERGGGDADVCFCDQAEKEKEVFKIVKTNPMGADLKWSLFRAASESYKYNSLLKPFPKEFFDTNGEKMIAALRNTAETFRRLSDADGEIPDSVNVPADLLNVLHWVLFEGIIPDLIFVPKSDHNRLLESCALRLNSCPPPTSIFKVDYPPAFTKKFASLAQTYGTRFGFHGSRLENFVSILNYGLQVSMMKVGAFGPGVYLTSELGISLQYSPHGLSWGGSSLGSLLSVVAVCEMISHPAVRCRTENGRHSGSVGFGGEKGPVPNKYFIVENSDLVQLRYLLVYGKHLRSGSSKSSFTFPSRRRIVILIISYFFVFASIFGLRYLYSIFSLEPS